MIKTLTYLQNSSRVQLFLNAIAGDSSVNMSTTLSLLLVLLKTTKQYLEENPDFVKLLPCPDVYSQR